jgi:hypothetical protein
LLAEHFNAYLTDPDECRAIMRNRLHVGGQVDYATKTITITWTGPSAHESPAPFSYPPKSSTPHQRPARRPPPTDLPARRGVNLNGDLLPT